MSEASRNVFVVDYEGAIIAGFWQYDTVTSVTFHQWLQDLLEVNGQWSLFRYDEQNMHVDIIRESDATVLEEGLYALLTPDGDPIDAKPIGAFSRPRIPTRPNTPGREARYHTRARERDGRCLITGLYAFGTWTGFKTAHIFPRVHHLEWVQRGYPSQITDTASIEDMGGSTKIDSLQNVILLRTDIRDAWGIYGFGINPDDDYRVTPFIGGCSDLANSRLDLSHIQDATIRPLDELLCDHFHQGLLKHVKGAGEPSWDFEDTMGNSDDFDLYNVDVWGTRQGKEVLELCLADRLQDHLLQQR